MSYFCPLHQDITASEPDTCKICGQSLMTKSATNVATANLNKLRFGISFILTFPQLVRTLDPTTQLVLATPLLLGCSWPFLARAWESIKKMQLTMFTLIGASIGIAYAVSLLEYFFSAHPTLFFKEASAITTFVLLGELVQEVSQKETYSAVKFLLGMFPEKATKLFSDGHQQSVLVSELGVGDFVRVQANERVPADGEVHAGSAQIDESMITGQANPVQKGFYSQVFAGTLNKQGNFVLRVDKVGSETMLAKTLDVIQNALKSTQTASSLFIGLVLGLSFFAFLIWTLLGSFKDGIDALIATLIIASPAALALSRPIATQIALGKCATSGILVRSSDSFEKMSRIMSLIIDKTGILTQGKPQITTLLPVQGVSKAELLQNAASLEAASGHPFGMSIMEKAFYERLSLLPTDSIQQIPGVGLKGRVNGKQTVVGNEQLLHDIELGEMKAKAQALRDAGQVVFFCAQEGKLLGMLALSDPLRESAKGTVKAMQQEGVKLICLSGDRPDTVSAVCKAVGISDYRSEVTSDQKALFINTLQSKGYFVAMAGDAKRDERALSVANVKIVMETNLEAMHVTADVVLVNSDLSGIMRYWHIAKETVSIIGQNLFLSRAYNAIGLILAIFGCISPIKAVIAMVAMSLIVIFNAQRLTTMKF